MKYLITLFLSVAIPLITLCQSNYHPAYVIKNSGDTVRGYINYREWSKSPERIEFKTTTGDKAPITFDVRSIKSFQVTNLDNYITYYGPVSIDRVNLADLSNTLDTATRQDSIFLKVLSSGPNVSLLYYRDDIKERFFLQEQGSLPFELEFHEFNRDSKVITYAPFRSRLMFLLKKHADADENLIQDVMNAEYREDVLMKYSRIINNNMSKITNRRPSGTRLFAGTGVVYSQAIFSGPQVFGFPGSSSSSSTSPLINIGIDLFNNINVQKYIIRLEASAFNESATFHGDIAYFTYKKLTTNLCPQIIYNIYNSDKFKYFVGVGLELIFIKYQTNKLVATQSNLIFDYDHIKQPYESFKTLNAGESYDDPYASSTTLFNPQLKTGIVFNKKIEISLDTTPNYVQLNSAYHPGTSGSFIYKSQTFSLSLNYLFGAK